MKRSELDTYSSIKNSVIGMADDLKYTLSEPEEKVGYRDGKNNLNI